MGKVTESIWSGKTLTIPLADVQHTDSSNPYGLIVVTRHTRWDFERDFWANNIWIDISEAADFKAAWCRYRSELEADTLADLEQPGTGVTITVNGVESLVTSSYINYADIAALAGQPGSNELTVTYHGPGGVRGTLHPKSPPVAAMDGMWFTAVVTGAA